MTFQDFELSEEVLKGVTEAGFKEPSPIQKEAIPAVLAGKDIVAQAHTGTGKTAAFGLPIMTMMNPKEPVQVLVITPTRELAMQVSDELYKLGKFAGIRTVTVYGGTSYGRQVDQIKRGSNIIVATPGRLLDLLKSKKIDIYPNYVVLDEADEMLDMGFLDDINEIFSYIPETRQTLLFSATMPEPIKRLAGKILKEPQFIQITQRETTNKNISQEYYVVEEKERIDAVIRLMNFYDPTKSIIFCRMKREADDLAHNLTAKGYMAKALHGDMDQRAREETIRNFKKGNIDTLVATDVAARGLDIDGVSHVFNYHIPFDPESYVHRIGRTGRAGKTGMAITLVTPMEFRELQRIKKIIGATMEHKFIPSKSDVKDDMSKKLIKEVEEQKIYNQASDLVKILEEEMELSQITFKLMSMLIDGQQIHGPDKIGIDKQRLDKMLENFKKNGRNRSGGGRGGYRGGRGGGGGNRSRNRSGDRNRDGRSRDSRNSRTRDGGGNRGRDR